MCVGVGGYGGRGGCVVYISEEIYAGEPALTRLNVGMSTTVMECKTLMSDDLMI